MTVDRIEITRGVMKVVTSQKNGGEVLQRVLGKIETYSDNSGRKVRWTVATGKEYPEVMEKLEERYRDRREGVSSFAEGLGDKEKTFLHAEGVVLRK